MTTPDLPPNVIAYKFQSPDGSYWYIRADDQRTLDYWSDKRKLTPLTDDKARIAAGAVSETTDLPLLPLGNACKACNRVWRAREQQP